MHLPLLFEANRDIFEQKAEDVIPTEATAYELEKNLEVSDVSQWVIVHLGDCNVQ